MQNDKAPKGSGKALFAAVSMLGLALGVSTASADPPPASPWGSADSHSADQGKTANMNKGASGWASSTDEKPGNAQSNQHKGASAQKSNQLKSNQLKSNQLKSNQIKLNGMEGGEIPKGMEGGEMPKGPGV